MKSKKEWETQSLEWIHRVREEMDQELKGKNITLAEWIKQKSGTDVASQCKRLGLRKFQVVRTKEKVS